MAELTAPLVYKNEEKRIVYGPVLVPDEPDTDDDVVTAEKIEVVAHKFVEDYGNIDLMHSLNNVGRLVESYILPVDLEVDEDKIIPKGSWMMGVRVTDDNSWEAVKDGKLGGFSIMALQKTAIKSSEKGIKESKRVTLADLGEDWIVNAVSLVDEPAVPKAKWIAIKSKNNINSNIDNEVVEKAVEGSLEHRKRLLDERLEQMFANYERYPTIHSTMMDSVIFRIHDDKGTRKTFQVGYQLNENGNVEFTNEPKEVKIQENVVEIHNMLGKQKNSSDSENKKERTESFMSKFMKSLGLGSKKSENQKEKGAGKMKKEDIQKMIDDSMEPINSKIDDVLKAMKEEFNIDGEEVAEIVAGKDKENHSSEKSKNEEQEEHTTKSKDDKQDIEEDYKEKYESVLKELENRPFSHRLTGQDSVEKSKDDDEPKDDRNAFGFKSK